VLPRPFGWQVGEAGNTHPMREPAKKESQAATLSDVTSPGDLSVLRLHTTNATPPRGRVTGAADPIDTSDRRRYVRNPAQAAKGRTNVLPFVLFAHPCAERPLAVAADAAYLGWTSGASR
jgi:hypothetical protein